MVEKKLIICIDNYLHVNEANYYKTYNYFKLFISFLIV